MRIADDDDSPIAEPPRLHGRAITPNRPIHIEGLRVINFRRIANLDVKIPAGRQIVCLTGPIGAGKSALLSLMSRAIYQLTKEALSDELAPYGTGRGESRRTLSRAEIGSNGPVYGIRMDWSWGMQTLTHHTIVGEDRLYRSELRALRAELGAPLDSQVDMGPKALDHGGFRAAWATPIDEDPIESSVFLVRPANRYETPYFEEMPGKMTMLSSLPSKPGLRPLRVRSESALDRAESFVLDMRHDAAAYANNHSIAIPARRALDKISLAYARMADKDPASVELTNQPWPFRRVGIDGLRALTLLSSGELDVMMTVAEIAQQQLYLQRMREAGDEPSGVVYIDEIEAHLPPRRHEKVLPLLAELFPTVHFIVTTHSPLVLRSLPKNKYFVVRLPDDEASEDGLG